MKQETKTILEAWAKKAGFYQIHRKETWAEGRVPNMKIIDLSVEPPWIGISAGANRIEAEDSGIASIQDYKEIILKLYNQSENKKPSEADSHKSDSSQEEEVSHHSPPILNEIQDTSSLAPSGGESHQEEPLPFMCSACQKPISATQRSETVKSCKRALCETCSKIPLVPNAEEGQTKLNVTYICYDCQKGTMQEQEGKASEKKYGFPVCKACSEIRDTKAAAKENKKKTAAKKKEVATPEAPKECKHLTFQWQTPDKCVCMDCGVDITNIKVKEPGYTQPQLKEQINPVMCQDCGFELSHVRALEYNICEGCAEKRRIAAEKTIPLKTRESTKEKPMPEKNESKEIIPAGKPGANAPVPMSDHERDQQIEKAKAKRFLEGQGGSYKVNGNEVPDSARIQNIANEVGVSVQILESEQNNDYARVRVRGNLGNQFVDGEVWVDFKTETQLLMMEFMNKNPGILDHFDGLNPVLKEGAQIKNYDGTFTDAKYALVHAMLTLRKFAVRTAATKASKIVQMKLLNKEFREKEEVADEQKESDLINEKKKQRR